MNTIKRGDVFFCLGSPDAVGSEERKTRPVVIVQNNAGNASSPTVIVANMTTNTTRRLYPMQKELRKLDDCLAVSFGMTRQDAQEGPRTPGAAGTTYSLTWRERACPWLSARFLC
jgi:mRNA-degrading endonuclease toxin of MazEF toxin-antitoxin module